MSTPGRDQLWLLNEAGYWLLGPSREVEWSFMYPDRKQQTLETRYPDAWARIQRGPGSGQFATEAGLFTYVNLPRELSDAAAGGSIEPDRRAPRLPAWILIAFTPQSVLDANLAPLKQQLMIATAVLLLLFAIASWFLALYWEDRRAAEVQMKALNERLARDNAELDALNRETRMPSATRCRMTCGRPCGPSTGSARPSTRIIRTASMPKVRDI